MVFLTSRYSMGALKIEKFSFQNKATATVSYQALLQSMNINVEFTNWENAPGYPGEDANSRAN